MAIDPFSPQGLTIIGLLVTIAVTAFRGDWESRRAADARVAAVQKELDRARESEMFWRDIALRTTNITGQALPLAAQAVRDRRPAVTDEVDPR